jgi:Na+/melibiose symporter-like transporter
MITFATTQERIQPVTEAKSSPRQDFADLLDNVPWRAMTAMTVIHFAILSFRGGALYNYYHHYADKAAMFDAVERLGLTAPIAAAASPKTGGTARNAWLYCARGSHTGGQFERRRRVQQHY